MELDVNDKCFICREALRDSETTTVRARGIATFIESSLKRQDGTINILRGRESIVVHDSCRKMYNMEKNITAFVKKKKILEKLCRRIFSYGPRRQ